MENCKIVDVTRSTTWRYFTGQLNELQGAAGGMLSPMDEKTFAAGEKCGVANLFKYSKAQAMYKIASIS
jgi:hypothetical protein